MFHMPYERQDQGKRGEITAEDLPVPDILLRGSSSSRDFAAEDLPLRRKLLQKAHLPVPACWEDLLDPATWKYLSDFDWVLRLIDFEGLRPVLAQRLGWTSAQGKKPFDPISRLP